MYLAVVIHGYAFFMVITVLKASHLKEVNMSEIGKKREEHVSK